MTGVWVGASYVLGRPAPIEDGTATREEVRGRASIMRADARQLPLPDASVDLIVTSPP